MINSILQISKVDSSLLGEIKESFNHLPETDHSDGKYRLRKYCKVHVKISDNKFLIKKLDEKTFTQSRKFNKFQGGMSRFFDSVDDDVIESKALEELATVFCDSCCSNESCEFDIHQMRVRCLGGATQLSPEGWHQDGYDRIGIIGFERNNIIGGEVLLSTNKTETPFLQAVIDSGTMVIVDDNYLWHNGRSIQPIDDSKPAWIDVMIFTYRK